MNCSLNIKISVIYMPKGISLGSKFYGHLLRLQNTATHSKVLIQTFAKLHLISFHQCCQFLFSKWPFSSMISPIIIFFFFTYLNMGKSPFFEVVAFTWYSVVASFNDNVMCVQCKMVCLTQQADIHLLQRLFFPDTECLFTIFTAYLENVGIRVTTLQLFRYGDKSL